MGALERTGDEPHVPLAGSRRCGHFGLQGTLGNAAVTLSCP